jgi:hypothetical protein
LVQDPGFDDEDEWQDVPAGDRAGVAAAGTSQAGLVPAVAAEDEGDEEWMDV